MKRVALKFPLLLLRLYQLTLSYFWGNQCRFQPTCSAYAIEAVQRHGLIKGGGLAARRICRCGPNGGMGYDPVPECLDKASSHAISSAKPEFRD